MRAARPRCGAVSAPRRACKRHPALRAAPRTPRRVRCAPDGDTAVTERLGDVASDDVALVGRPAAWATAPPPPPLLCAFDACALLAARAAGATSAAVSLDMGRTPSAAATLSAAGVLLSLPSSTAVPAALLCWADVEAVAADANGVHQLLPAPATSAAASLARIATFSDSTSRPVSLFPPPSGRGAPSALIAGFAMHRFGKGIDPATDTARKIAALAPLRPGARVLDICTGLGYTSLAAAQRGAAVTTVELDEAMQALCAANPWSRLEAPLVALPGPAAAPGAPRGSVTQLFGDAAQLVQRMPDCAFDRICHDPPSFALAGMLYSAEFYAELARILAPKGKLYHYIGDPESAHGARVARGVVKRLRDVGFVGVAIDTYAHGVVAAHEYVRATRPRPEAPGRRPPGAAKEGRGYGMKGRRDDGAGGGGAAAIVGRTGKRLRGAAAAALVRAQRAAAEADDEDDSDGEDQAA